MFENRKTLHSKQFCLCACQSFDSQFCWNAGQGLKRKCKKMITPSPSCVWYRLLTVHLVLFFIHPGFLGRGCTMWAYFVCLISINTLRGFSKPLTAISAPSLFLVPSYTLTETEKEDFNSAGMTISQKTALKPGINFQVHLTPNRQSFSGRLRHSSFCSVLLTSFTAHFGDISSIYGTICLL